MSVMDPFSEAEFASLVGEIYGCVLVPDRWPSTLDAIRRRLGFSPGWPNGHALADRPAPVPTVGLDNGCVQAASHMPGEAVKSWGATLQRQPVRVAERIDGRPSGTPHPDTSAPRGDLAGAAKAGLGWLSSAAFAPACGPILDEGALPDERLHLLRLLAPHLQRAISFGNIRALQAARQEGFEAAIDVIQSGVLFVDDRLALIHCNAAARAMLDREDPLFVKEGLICLLSNATQTTLVQGVRRSWREPRPGVGAKGLAAPRASGEAALVQVVPLLSGHDPNDSPRMKVVAALVVTPSKPSHAPREALSLLFGLTQAEARVLTMIGEGLEPSAIAGQLRLKTSTVKTHLKHLFQKTGTKRQADLVKLAMSLAMNV